MNSLDNKIIMLRCMDNQEMLMVTKINDYYNDTPMYQFSFQDSYICDEHNNIRGRIKRAFKILFGKPICYLDLYIEDKAEIKRFISDLDNMIKGE